VLLGLGLSAWVLLGERVGNGAAPRPNPEARAPRESEPPVAQAPGETRPRYDFYTVLAEREVRIPDTELAEQARREPTAAPGGDRYLLQAGAFADAKDAEAVKARLALIGLVARVETGAVNGRQIHRVRLGPYASARELDAAKRQLAENGVPDTIAIRERAN
jgi:cell division protein FtsN